MNRKIFTYNVVFPVSYLKKEKGNRYMFIFCKQTTIDVILLGLCMFIDVTILGLCMFLKRNCFFILNIKLFLKLFLFLYIKFTRVYVFFKNGN